MSIFRAVIDSVFWEKASLKSFMEADIVSASKYMVLVRLQERHRMYSQESREHLMLELHKTRSLVYLNIYACGGTGRKHSSNLYH